LHEEKVSGLNVAKPRQWLFALTVVVRGCKF